MQNVGAVSILVLVSGVFHQCVGCGSNDEKRTSIRLGDYETSCSTAEDCVPVSVGNYCPCVPCANASINKTSLAKYQSDVASVDCPDTTAQCAPCPPPLPGTDCQGAKCVLLQ
jgi:hypothetical protein